MRNFVLLLFFIAFHQTSYATKALDFGIHQEYTSTRALAMGNAFTAVADDHSSMFYNPATLAFRSDGQLRMFLRAGTTPESLKIMNDIEKVGSMPEDDQPQGYSDILTENYGKHMYYRVPTIGAVWVRPNWGIALLPADLSLDAVFHRQMGPTLNVNLYVDTTLAFSYARKLKWLPKSHDLSWGVTVKSMHRIYAGEALSAAQFVEGGKVIDTSHATEGLTADLDLGTYWKPPVPKRGFFGFLKYMEPSFALVGRNLVDYGFTTNFHFIDPNSGEPPKLQRRIDFGSKWQLPKFWVFDPKISADVRDMLHDNWSIKKGYHVGFEAYWKMFNWWKGYWAAGLNQGYWTAGIGAKMAFFQLDVASFGEEVGTSSNPHESRRYMVELALDF